MKYQSLAQNTGIIEQWCVAQLTSEVCELSSGSDEFAEQQVFQLPNSGN